MEEKQITLQDWLNLLISRRSSTDSKVNYYFGGALSLFVLSMTLGYLIYFETGELFPIGLSVENLLAIPLKIIMICLFYIFLLECFRLVALNDLINKIMVEDKTKLEYIKEKYQLIEEMFESLSILTQLKNYNLIKEE